MKTADSGLLFKQPADGFYRYRPQAPAVRLASPAPAAAGKVAVLLCTYHGQHYLSEQLDSLAQQIYPNWEIWASDDNSQDDTHAILLAHQLRLGADRLTIHDGPAEGFAANFLSLICNADIAAEYYAFSDQDDIWERDKLTRAVAALDTVPANVPALYCSRTRLIDQDNNSIGYSPLFTRKPGFANALVQNIGGGNTMVLNNAARKLLMEAGADTDVVSHDWWAYMIIAGCGGRVFYDAYPSLRYRQHDANVVGMNAGWRARVERVGLLFAGRFRYWSASNIRALEKIHYRLTPESQRILADFKQARQQWLLPRLAGLLRAGIYRQTVLGNLGLAAAALLNKI
ncbi:MAG TPA: glycosyltransferase family 2 protein [Burkholderiaceae bacterium]